MISYLKSRLDRLAFWWLIRRSTRPNLDYPNSHRGVFCTIPGRFKLWSFYSFHSTVSPVGTTVISLMADPNMPYEGNWMFPGPDGVSQLPNPGHHLAWVKDEK